MAILTSPALTFQQNMVPGSWQRRTIWPADILKHGDGKQEVVFNWRSEHRRRDGIAKVGTDEPETVVTSDVIVLASAIYPVFTVGF